MQGGRYVPRGEAPGTGVAVLDTCNEVGLSKQAAPRLYLNDLPPMRAPPAASVAETEKSSR